MALGALSKVANGQMGTTLPLIAGTLKFAGDNAYPTGGTAAFQAKVRALYNDSREVLGVVANDCGAYRPVYDKTNDKLMVFVNATGAEVGNGVDLSGTTFNLVVLAV